MTPKNSPPSNEIQGDKWIRCIAQGGNLHATAISATNLVADAQARHKLSQQGLVALGEALVSGLLLASTCKKGERISLSVNGDGFLRQAFVDAEPNGTVRGFLLTREKTKKKNSKLGPWQTGTVSVTRLKLNETEPYVGTVPIVTGHLPKDITFYLSQSEQIPSAVGVAVNVNKKGEVESAGGFLVQVMPGASINEIKQLETNISQLQSLAAKISQNSNPVSLLGQIFSDVAFTILEEAPVGFLCNCSRDRVSRALRLLGADELKDMIAKDHGAEISCDFCAKKYSFSEIDLEQLVGRLQAH